LLREQCELVSRRQALACGVSAAQLRSRLRPDGPWKVVLPGIYLARNGLLTVGQRERAATLYAGDGSVISGRAALARQGVRLPHSDLVDVLVPHDRRARIAAEVDSREWHYSAADWSKTMARHERMSARGILVLHFTPNRIRTAPREVVNSLKSALQTRLGCPTLPIRAVPAR
jgi:hypothetical protein